MHNKQNTQKGNYYKNQYCSTRAIVALLICERARTDCELLPALRYKETVSARQPRGPAAEPAALLLLKSRARASLARRTPSEPTGRWAGTWGPVPRCRVMARELCPSSVCMTPGHTESL